MKGLAACMAALAAGGCYQAFSAGYSQRLADEGGHSFEGQWLLAMGEVLGHDEPTGFAKVSVAGGTWGMRAADVVGVMLQEDMGGSTFFLRPGLDFIVIGSEAQRDELWVGIGADLDVGFLVPLDDDIGVELGVHTGADLSYTGHGSGGFFGAYLAIGWVFGGPDWDTH